MNTPESFESVYKRLEETVRRLEEGGLTLDESITLYEEGMQLAKSCQTLLEQAELRVTTLQELFAGAVATADLDDDD
jgi:exodeoxyribonuclease VII small subunit